MVLAARAAPLLFLAGTAPDLSSMAAVVVLSAAPSSTVNRIAPVPSTRRQLRYGSGANEDTGSWDHAAIFLDGILMW